MPEHQIVLLGQSGVGKTSLGTRFIQNTFIRNYDPTIEDSYRKNLQIGGIHYLIEVIDTAGSEQMSAVRDLNWKDGGGFILVFSITSRSSFEVLGKLREIIIAVTDSSEFPCLVVGTKTDLDEKREVTTEEGKTWAAEFACDYAEVSSKLDKVDHLFKKILENVLDAETLKLVPTKEEVKEEEKDEMLMPKRTAVTARKSKRGSKANECVVQ